jgi:hypothetical protein
MSVMTKENVFTNHWESSVLSNTPGNKGKSRLAPSIADRLYEGDAVCSISLLPRRAGCNHDLCDPHVRDALSEGRAIDAVPIAEEIPGGIVPRKRLDYLSSSWEI